MKLKGLCPPAKFYLYLSVFGLLLSLVQNAQNLDNNKYKCGSYSANVPSVLLIFVFKMIYIVFWTYVLNLLCRDDNKPFAWLLVLFPFILLFVILGVLLLTGGEKTTEGFKEGTIGLKQSKQSKPEDYADEMTEDKAKQNTAKAMEDFKTKNSSGVGGSRMRSTGAGIGVGGNHSADLG